MIIFEVSTLPKVGDNFKYNGRSWIVDVEPSYYVSPLNDCLYESSMHESIFSSQRRDIYIKVN